MDDERRQLTDLEAIDPDRHPADGGIWIEEHLGSILWVLRVTGRGALVLRVDDTETPPTFKGCSMFTEDEIRWKR